MGSRVAMLFPGLGDQQPGVARELYESEPVFRAELDHCAELLLEPLGADLREVIYPTEPPAPKPDGGGIDLRRMVRRGPGGDAGRSLRLTQFAQPAVFVLEYALARLWRASGVVPSRMIGYSIGEYVAACLSGVLSLEDALTLVVGRAKLIAELPPGAMLAVPLPEDEVRPWLAGELSVAAVNLPRLCVVSGPPEVVRELSYALMADGCASIPVPTTHAFHSSMMEPVVAPYRDLVESVRLNPPRIPYVSNVTGDWIRAEQATDPAYWAEHTRAPVRFAAGILRLCRGWDGALLEVGPARSLSSIVRQALSGTSDQPRLLCSSLPSRFDSGSDAAHFAETARQLAAAGA